jgi:NAD(P)-dependent dehydrogenase (short-subunit alcohol dehydrogenase family)
VSVAGRTAVLTGVTGGWGRAVLDRFCAEGWNVAATYREEQAPSDLPDGVLAVRAELSDPDAASAAIAAAVDAFGSVDALAHVAGGFAAAGRLDEQPVDVWRAQMTINLDTAYYMTRAVLGPMRKAGRGAIVYIGTSAMLTPFSGASGYIVSKVALGGLMRCVDVEVRQEGIRCNTVVVRIVDTPRNRAENPDADFGRWTTGEELAEVVEWLCTDASAPLSGGLFPAYGRA